MKKETENTVKKEIVTKKTKQVNPANQKKDVKKSKKRKTKKEKKSLIKRLTGFMKDVRKEMKKVHWPSKKEMVKYSIATLVFVIFFSLFFYIIDIIFAFVKSLF